MLEKLQEQLNKLRGKIGGKTGGVKKRNKAALSFDLLYQLSYMSVIAAGGVPRSHIFESAAELDCAPTEYFRKIELACKRLKYDYAQACRIVGESAEEEEIKGLLLRFANSLHSGEPEADFLAREAKVQAESYQNEYGRKLEALKMWSDAYVSLILSGVLVIIIGVVSTMIWRIENGIIMGMALLSVMTTTMGVWLIYIVSPKEVMVLSWAGSREQKLAQKLFKFLVPGALVIAALFMLVGANLGAALLAVAVILFPLGFIMSTDSKNIVKKDAEVGTFLRSLGAVCAALGTTVTSALGRIDMDAINNLRDTVKRLNTRLTAGIRPKFSWKKFIDETGSELTNRSVGMFYDTIDLGGSPGHAGYQASLYADNIALLRARRRTVSMPFRWLCLTMHAAIIALLVFITEVVRSFAGMVATAQETMPKVSGAPDAGAFTSFNISGLEMMHALIVPLVLVFTLADAIAPSIADGGSWYKVLQNLSYTAAISGVSLMVLPMMAEALFKSVQM